MKIIESEEFEARRVVWIAETERQLQALAAKWVGKGCATQDGEGDRG